MGSKRSFLQVEASSTGADYTEVEVRGASKEIIFRGLIETLKQTSYNACKLAAVQNGEALVPCLPR
jgi:hypothetical protein